MKKGLLIIGGVVVLALILVMSFGIQIGDVRIGKQNDTLGVKQDVALENSLFAEEYLASDAVICINLWATWCKPCIEEMPMLNEIKKTYSGENVRFISFSVDTDSVKLAQFNEKGTFEFKDITLENLAYKTVIMNFLDGKPLDNKINSYRVPATYLVKDNKVVHKIVGAIGDKQELMKEINTLLD